MLPSNRRNLSQIINTLNIPKLLSMYRDGQLKLDELITRRYTLDQINEGYQDMRDGVNIRGVITFD